ncbi:zinc knuckle CX2CX4HX4C containing protein [Tanacetum coccineum]
MKKQKENVHAIQVGCQTCEGVHLDNDCPLNKEVKGMEEVKYGEFNRPFPNNRYDGRFNKGGYDHPSSGEKRPNLTEIINKYMEEASKIQAEQNEWLKKFYQSTKASRETHDKIIQGLEAKVKTLANEVEGLNFKNALADLGASISIIPFSMYKRLGIRKLEPINMIIEMADNTKCTSKGIVENLLIKIDKFIFPIDFVILDMVEDIRMPIILGRPLLATAHANLDIFRKSISLEVGSEKVIFKMSSFTTTNFESVRSIKSKTFLEDDDFEKIDYDLFLYDSESCEFNRLLHINPDIFSYEVDIHESYEEIVYKLTEVENEKYSAPQEKENIGVGQLCKKRKRFGDEEDDLEENLEDLEECGEDKANAILGVIHDKLNNNWFNNTSEDEDDLEGILDYLKPRSYDGFIDLDDEAYNKRRCRLLGMTYEEPTPIIFEKAKVTRYTVGPGETYTKVKLLGVEKIPRTRGNIAAIRA